MRVINLFAGPGAGKSTVAAGLFCALKMKHVSVELVTEYAKDLVHSNQIEFLQSNQEFVFAEQARRQHVLNGKVDFAITDSPLLLSHVYALQYANNKLPQQRLDAFLTHVTEVFNSYDNLNIMLKRNEASFQQAGRVQTLDESLGIDNKLMSILNTLGVPYEVVQVNEHTIERILMKL